MGRCLGNRLCVSRSGDRASGEVLKKFDKMATRRVTGWTNSSKFNDLEHWPWGRVERMFEQW